MKCNVCEKVLEEGDAVLTLSPGTFEKGGITLGETKIYCDLCLHELITKITYMEQMLKDLCELEGVTKGTKEEI